MESFGQKGRWVVVLSGWSQHGQFEVSQNFHSYILEPTPHCSVTCLVVHAWKEGERPERAVPIASQFTSGKAEWFKDPCSSSSLAMTARYICSLIVFFGLPVTLRNPTTMCMPSPKIISGTATGGLVAVSSLERVRMSRVLAS
jgi:hypothetical protein